MGIKISASSSFKRAFKKKICRTGALEKRFWEKLDLFSQNPFDSTLRTHKLSGELEGLWSFSVDYDCRVVLKFFTPNNVMLIDIGTHDEVY